MTAVDAIIRSCLLLAWDVGRGRAHACSHTLAGQVNGDETVEHANRYYWTTALLWKWKWKCCHMYKLERFLLLFFFGTLLLLAPREVQRLPLVMLLLGAVNGNVRRLSKWWDLTYGIKASLDLHLLQMESALSRWGSAPRGGLLRDRQRIRRLVTHTHCAWITIYSSVLKDPEKATSPCLCIPLFFLLPWWSRELRVPGMNSPQKSFRTTQQ